MHHHARSGYAPESHPQAVAERVHPGWPVYCHGRAVAGSTAMVEPWQGNHEFYSSMLNSSQYLIDLSQSGSNHFLSEDMFACLSSGDHHIMMKVCRRIDDDTINISSRQNIIEFLVKWNVQSFGFCAATFRRFIPYGHNFCSRICLRLFDIVLGMNMPETQHCNTNHYSSPPLF